MDKHKISISFKADRLHIYNYLKNTDGIKDNISAYICNLIEQDMLNSSSTTLEQQVRELVSQLLNNYVPNQSHIKPANNTLNDEDIDLINSLF